MKTSGELDTISPLRENIRTVLTIGAVLFPFLPNTYRTFYLCIALISLIYRFHIFTKRDAIPFYIYLLAAILTSLFSLNPLKAIRNTKGIFFDILVPFLFFAFSPFLNRQKITRLLPVSSIIFSAAALLIYFIYPPGFHIFNRNHGLVGFLGGKLTYAGALSFLIPLLYFTGERKQDILTLIAIALFTLNITFNLSRTYYIAVIVFLLLMIIVSRSKIRLFYGGLLAFFIISIVTNQRSLDYLSKMLPIEENRSPHARIEMWKTGLRIFKKYPLTGIGYELWSDHKIFTALINEFETPELHEIREDPKLNRAVSGHLHSNYIMAMVNGGLPLLFSLLFIFLYFLAIFCKTAQPWGYLGIGLLSIMIIAGFFEYNFSDAEVVQNFAMALGIITHRVRCNENNC